MKILLLILGSLNLAWTAPLWTWNILDSMPHPRGRFTEGLQWFNGELYESTGLEGKSTLYRMNGKGKVLDSVSMAPPYFGEGICVSEGEIQWMTWQSGLYFTYTRKTLDLIHQTPLMGEGWGLTFADGEYWQSNGSAQILRWNGTTRQVQGKINIRDGGQAISMLNELEAIGPYILANVWQSDRIAIIQRSSGQVVAWLDFTALAQKMRAHKNPVDVLNGIAWDGKNVWITGKFWPQYYKLKIPALDEAIFGKKSTR